MANVSTYGIFTMARLGIYAASQGINVTGNNISNINTEGYTRQSLDQYSMHMVAADRYNQTSTLRMGAGVIAPSVSQTRDQYLDIRYRNEQTHVGNMESTLDGYQHLSTLFDEVNRGEDGEGVLEAMFNTAVEQLDSLVAEGAGKGQNDTLFRASMDSIVRQINKTATDLEALQETRVEKMEDDIDHVNYLLDRIRYLNSTIRKNTIYGDSSLELKDERNLLIDDLSKYMSIHVTYESEQVAPGVQADKLVIRTQAGKNAITGDPNPARLLVDGIYATELEHRTGSAAQAAAGLFDPDNYDLNLKELTDPYGFTRILQETNLGAVKNRDIEAVKDENDNVLFFDNLEEAQELADELSAEATANATGTEFRVVVNDEGEITVHEFGTTVYTSSEDAALALEELRGSYKSQTRVNSVTGEVTRSEIKVVDQGGGLFEVDEIEIFRGAVQLGDTELDGTLLADREMLTEKGVYASEADLARDAGAAGKHGIPFYQKALDTLAYSMAAALNEANTLPYETTCLMDNSGNFVDEDGNIVTDPDEYVLKPEYSHYNGGVLLSNSPENDDGAGITAKNISISKNWSNGTFRVLTTTKPLTVTEDGMVLHTSTANDNLDHIRNVFIGRHEFSPNSEGVYEKAASNDVFFRGSFQELFTDHIAAVLGTDTQLSADKLDNYNLNADQLYINRDGVMGVDLNDEAMDLMSYQKAYAASCRLMTVFDEMLDKLINGTGRT